MKKPLLNILYWKAGAHAQLAKIINMQAPSRSSKLDFPVGTRSSGWDPRSETCHNSMGFFLEKPLDVQISRIQNTQILTEPWSPKTNTCGISTTPKMKGGYNNCFKAANVISSANFKGKPKVSAAFRNSARLLRQVVDLMPKLCDNNALKASEDTWSWSPIGLTCHSLKKLFPYAKPKLPIWGQLDGKKIKN